MSLRDIKVPADNSDKQTTDAKSALPPVEFTVTQDTTTGANSFVIQDRQFVSDRGPTASYRVYFLPGEFAPNLATLNRVSGQKVANLVAEVSSTGRGDALPLTDISSGPRVGYYYCTAVNRVGVEAPPEHICKAP